MPLQWVTSIKYLGVKITARIQDYITLNLLPLLTLLKQRVQSWSKLSLSLIGRISLLKMKFLPVLLYFLRHAPVWVPKTYFRQIEGIISSFLWTPKPPRIGTKVLQEPGDQRGLALPDWLKYYLAGQLVFARRWLLSDEGDAATVLEAAHLGSYESLRLALFRGTKSDLPLTETMKVTIRAWELAVKLASPSYAGLSPSSPIWMNHKLPHFYNIPDPGVWAVKGVKTLKDITLFGDLLTFFQMQARHELPNSYLFRFFQIRHAFPEQGKETRVESLPSTLESLLSAEDLKKVLS